MACKPSERARQKGKMIFMILLTTGMFVTEIVVGYRTGSLALVNDSFNMISAIISLVIGFICLWLSTKETKKNTYGWARVEIWAALVNSVFMLALCFSIFTSAVQRLITPEKVKEADLVLIVGGVGFAVNLIGIGVFLNETVGDLKKNKEKTEEARNENCPRHGSNNNAGLANPAFIVDNNNVDITNNSSNNNVNIVNNYNNNSNSNVDIVNNYNSNNVDITNNNSNNVDIVNNYNNSNNNNSNNNNNNNNMSQIVIEPKPLPAVKTRKLSVTEADFPQHWQHVRFGQIDTISEAVTRNGEISIDLETEVFPETNSPYPRRRSANADSICLDIPDDDGCDSPDDDEEDITNMVATVSHIYAGPPVEDEDEIPRKNRKKKKDKKMKSGNQMNIQGVFLHLLGDALGSVSVIVSGLINKYCQGDWVDRMDPAISLVVVIIIFISTIPLLRQTSNILLQRVPKNVNVPVLLEELKKEVRDIANIHDLHVWQLAGTRIIASLHIRCSDLTQYIRASKQIKAFFHNNGIHSTTIQPEFLEHQETPTERECYLECGPELKCHEDTCCCVNKKSKKKKISTTSTASGISFQSALSTDTAISLESDLGGTTLI